MKRRVKIRANATRRDAFAMRCDVHEIFFERVTRSIRRDANRLATRDARGAADDGGLKVPLHLALLDALGVLAQVDALLEEGEGFLGEVAGVLDSLLLHLVVFHPVHHLRELAGGRGGFHDGSGLGQTRPGDDSTRDAVVVRNNKPSFRGRRVRSRETGVAGGSARTCLTCFLARYFCGRDIWLYPGTCLA